MRRLINEGEQFELISGNLKAVVLTPWSKRYYRSRFNHSGFIAEVWMDGICYTSAEETPDGRKEHCGMGLCSEYKCPGQDENVPIGGTWLKPGIGEIVRGSEMWNYLDPRDCQGANTSIFADDSSAVFTVNTPLINGYAYSETRKITVRDHSISQEITFDNTGEKEWKAIEYCHDFLSMDQKGINEHTRLLFPGAIITEEQEDGYGTRLNKYGISWDRIPEKSFLYKFPETIDAAFAWFLYNNDSGLSVCEKLSEKPCLLQVWGDKGRIAPESFVNICLQPGEKKVWTREWFFTK